MAKKTVAPRREVVLVGAGHSHVQTLKSFAMEPPQRARVTLVVDTPLAVYSGMVPGFVAGQYNAQELEIDAIPLARRAGARVVLSPATGIDTDAARLHVEGRPPLPYDLVSFDIGSTVSGLELPGVREFALPTRPIGHLVAGLEEKLSQGAPKGPVVVVGGGAGGVELVFALNQRLTMGQGAALGAGSASKQPFILVHGGKDILPGYPPGLVSRIRQQAERRAIEIQCSRRVVAVEQDRVQFEDGTSQPYGLLVWVTGATGKPLFTHSGLATDPNGFLRVRSTLQAMAHDQVFAVGDCACLDPYPDTPKAGVYAVRQGPFITRNLHAALAKSPLEKYRPQSDFLMLLNLGDGTAVGAKWGRSFGGSWVMRLKDRIDRKFMEKFQILDSGGQLMPAFAAQPAMTEGDEDMLCGGCAAKLGQSGLEKVLSRLGPAPDDESVVLGLKQADDVAAYRLRSGATVALNLDTFRSFTDDPYLVGKVAANNAMSDVLAKGVDPKVALALVQIEEDQSAPEREESLFQVMSGAKESLELASVSLVGGHTTLGTDLVVGFSVEGEVDPQHGAMWSIDRIEVGQHLVLTRPLGTGVLLYADMRGLARGPWVEGTLHSMSRSNADVVPLARQYGVTAATDVTGFGLAGHLGEMSRASGVATELWLSQLPTLEGALELLALGHRSTYHKENRRKRSALAIDPGQSKHPAFELLFDPQTAGGLLLALPADRSSGFVNALCETGFSQAAVVGQAIEATDEAVTRGQRPELHIRSDPPREN